MSPLQTQKEMLPLDAIVEYLKRKYTPLSIILYGSYASGTQDASSDFDALVIAPDGPVCHDTTSVEGTALDVFVYPRAHFAANFDLDEFLPVFDGKLLLDHDGIGATVQQQVQEYLQNRPRKTADQLQADLNWCAKMLGRAKRQDPEGMFRWHWVLTESLEIYFDLAGQPYWGPKKAMGWMARHDPAAFACYSQALQALQLPYLEQWIALLQAMSHR